MLSANQFRAIETSYKGCRFRSRLEARWAVFFDSMGIRWEYEPQGYFVGMTLHVPSCPDGMGGHAWMGAQDKCCSPKRNLYLPDFLLPDTKTWVEVKGTGDGVDWGLLAHAIDWGHGLPWTTDSTGTTRGLLILGPIPNVPDGWVPAHPILQHGKGGWVRDAWFTNQGIETGGPYEGYFDSSWGRDPADFHDLSEAVESRLCPTLGLDYDRNAVSKSVAAYRRARAARFEHGEKP